MSRIPLPRAGGAGEPEAAAAPVGERHPLRALRHARFRRYWGAQIVSLSGTWMQNVAQAWLMHRLTGSALMLGLLGAAQFLPVLFLSLPAGVLIDRVDKRKLILGTQIVALLQATLLALLVAFGSITPHVLLLLAFCLGAVSAFDLPARQSFVIELVGREDLSNAIALNSAAFNAARVVGPAVAGAVLASFGEAACFGANAVSYLAVVLALASLRTAGDERRARQPLRERLREGRAELAEGIRYGRGHAEIRNLLLILGVTTSLGFQYTTLLPIYAREILHVGEAGYGGLLSAFGLGSLLSALLMTRPHEPHELRRNLRIGLVVSGLALLGFAGSRIYALTAAFGFVAGFGLILFVASLNTLVQLTTEDRFRGRVMSLYTFLFIGTAPFGSFALGALAERFGAPLATCISGAVLLGGFVALVKEPEISSRTRPSP